MIIYISGSNVLYGQMALNALEKKYSPKMDNMSDLNLLVCLADFKRPYYSWWLFLFDYNQLKYLYFKKY